MTNKENCTLYSVNAGTLRGSGHDQTRNTFRFLARKSLAKKTFYRSTN